jgi:antitoxin component YwqK of YwqJK toxin-antitoxin module
MLTMRLQAQDSLYTYKGNTFNHITYYEGTSTAKIAGNYLPNSLIRHGEWIYFYPNGQPRVRMFFVKDLKRGVWVYYNEKGEVIRKERMHEKGDALVEPGSLDDLWYLIDYLLSRQHR